jgi:hypothetical protein
LGAGIVPHPWHTSGGKSGIRSSDTAAKGCEVGEEQVLGEDRLGVGGGEHALRKDEDVGDAERRSAGKGEGESRRRLLDRGDLVGDDLVLVPDR